MNQKTELHERVRFLTDTMEHTGFEPVTSTLPVWRAPSCANAPALVDNTINPDENQVLFFQLFILLKIERFVNKKVNFSLLFLKEFYS